MADKLPIINFFLCFPIIKEILNLCCMHIVPPICFLLSKKARHKVALHLIPYITVPLPMWLWYHSTRGINVLTWHCPAAWEHKHFSPAVWWRHISGTLIIGLFFQVVWWITAPPGDGARRGSASWHIVLVGNICCRTEWDGAETASGWWHNNQTSITFWRERLVFTALSQIVLVNSSS